MLNRKNIFCEEKEMQDITIEIYLNQEKDNKSHIIRLYQKFYKKSTEQLSNLLFLANPSEHSWQKSSI